MFSFHWLGFLDPLDLCSHSTHSAFINKWWERRVSVVKKKQGTQASFLYTTLRNRQQASENWWARHVPRPKFLTVLIFNPHPFQAWHPVKSVTYHFVTVVFLRFLPSWWKWFAYWKLVCLLLLVYYSYFSKNEVEVIIGHTNGCRQTLSRFTPSETQLGSRDMA